MKAGYFQYDVARGDKEKNLRKLREMESDCDLLVLPELSFTGYMFDSRDELYSLAETVPGGETERALRELSAKRKCTIIAGVAEKEGGNIYNTALIVSKGEYVGKYRKIHLSDYEKTLFAGGKENGVFKAGGIRFGVQICFDLWFPEISREQVLAGADLLCVLANFGGETTPKIARVRATENLTPLILCNRIGRETGKIDAEFLGNSMIIGQDGQSLCRDASDGETFAAVAIPQKSKGNVICADFQKEINFHYSIDCDKP